MAKSPNILLIIADDHRYETIGANRCGSVRTPHLDALAARGTAFDHAYCQGSMHPAVCAPSRASLMTGRNIFASSQDPTGFEYNGRAFAIPSHMPTLPEVLRNGGYRTHAIGKWHNDKAAFARSFSFGDRLMFGGMSDHDKVPLRRFDPTGRYPDKDVYSEGGFSTDLFRHSAVSFLRAHHGSAPFFLQVAFTAPHDPRSPPDGYRILPATVELPANTAPAHPFDNGEMMVRDETLEAFPRSREAIRSHIADYLGMVGHLDDGVGAILATLDETGLAADTIVVYTSDHGIALGQHGLMGKQNLYEHSLRVPLIFAGPGIEQNRRAPELVWHADTMATLLDVAGLPIAEECEGTSLKPSLEGTSATAPRSCITGVYGWVQRMARDDRYKLILYFEHPHGPSANRGHDIPTRGSRTEQLFDLENDPLETINLAFSPTFKDVRLRLIRHLLDWQRQVGDPTHSMVSDIYKDILAENT